MNAVRIILDGIAMSLIFNMSVAAFWFIMPRAYTLMFPKEIREKVGKVSKKEKLKLALFLYPSFIGIIIWMIFSLRNSGTEGFWTLFWSAYIEFIFIDLGDFIILDCLLRKYVKNHNPLEETKNCKAREAKNWMKSAIPEHFLFWPLILMPLVSLLIAFFANL